MLFNSFEFLFLFLPVTLVVYWLLKAHTSSTSFAISWLALASLGFYSWWNPLYLLLILGSITFNFTAGIILQKKSIGRITVTQKTRTVVLVLAVSVNILTLAYFKYYDMGIRLPQA